MTFYWWSHWFWITIITSFSLIWTTVHSYPSQETTSSKLEFNDNLSTQENKQITKLYQQLDYSTPRQQGTTKLHSILYQSREQNESKEFSSEEESNEMKRSIEDTTETLNSYSENATTESQKIEQANITQLRNPIALITTPLNNLTNFSSIEITTVSSSQNFSSIENLTNSTHDTQSIRREDDNDDEYISNTEWPKNKTLSVQGYHIKTRGKVDEDIEDTDSTASAASISVAIQKAPFTLENANKLEHLRQAETEQHARKSKVLAADYQIAHTFTYPADSKNLLTRSASIAPVDFTSARKPISYEGNISTEALAIKRTYFLDAGTISAICLTIFGICCTIGTLGTVLYRRRYLNKPQTLSEPDSSVYIDDSTMRISDNSDEMYSLDNDSFLNSLEAMTIQNYWTDTVKHTKL